MTEMERKHSRQKKQCEQRVGHEKVQSSFSEQPLVKGGWDRSAGSLNGRSD